MGWGVDNKGAMIRTVGGAGDPATRLENRSGEPAANPYLYVASQVFSGLAGIDGDLDPGPPTDAPYDDDAARRLPADLSEALDALRADAVLTAGLGREVVEWILTLKRAEVERYRAEVSAWEEREYGELF